MISIIVPIYNAEQYIHRCIDSILAQSFTDFELLLINDGSPDNCGVICDEYAAMDSRVRVFHKANGGVSSARNLGIERSQGEWITFIDADDYVHPKFLSSLYEKHDFDLIVGSFQIVGSNDIWNGTLKDLSYNRITLRKYIVELSSMINFQTPWGKLFRTNIIKDNQIKFDERICIGEDSLFILNYLLYTDTLRLSEQTYYYYERGNVGSLSQSLYPIEHHLHAMEAFYEMLNRLGNVFGVDVKLEQYRYIRNYCSKQIDFLYQDKSRYKYKRKCLKMMCKNKYLKLFFRYENTSYRKKIKLFHFFMRNGLNSISLMYIYMLKGCIYR